MLRLPVFFGIAFLGVTVIAVLMMLILRIERAGLAWAIAKIVLAAIALWGGVLVVVTLMLYFGEGLIPWRLK